MSDTEDHSSMQYIRSVVLGEADRFRRDGYSVGVVTIPVERQSSGHYFLRTMVKTVQNTFNIDIYSVIFLFENLFVQSEDGNGDVSLLLIIPEINPHQLNTLITESQVFVNSVDKKSFNGTNIEKFTENVPAAIAKKWNGN